MFYSYYYDPYLLKEAEALGRIARFLTAPALGAALGGLAGSGPGSLFGPLGTLGGAAVGAGMGLGVAALNRFLVAKAIEDALRGRLGLPGKFFMLF